jgi:hypothetical protein
MSLTVRFLDEGGAAWPEFTLAKRDSEFLLSLVQIS